MQTSIKFTAALAFAVGMFSCAPVILAESGVQTDWNEQYRSAFEVPVSKIYTGRSPFMRSVVKLLEKPTAAPARRPAPIPTATIKTSSGDGAYGLIHLSEVMPTETTAGDEFKVELSLTAQGNAEDVVVRNKIPANATYVRSEPAALVRGDQLVWKIGNLNAGQTLAAKIWFKATQEGAVDNLASVSASARVSGTTRVGKPALDLEQSGPESALLGADVTYHIVVKNTGTGTLRKVAVADAVPVGMSHASSKDELYFEVGDLAPGEAKPFVVTFKANQRGQMCNTATASSANAGKIDKTSCTAILTPSLKVETSGTKEQILGRNADYEIVVSNPGDTTFFYVVVNHIGEPETAIVAAPGATLNGNQATWRIPKLEPGAKHSAAIKLTSKAPGNLCNNVTASSSGQRDSAKACTLWKGIAAVALEVADDPDPIQVGESTIYTIKVTNQGSADLHNLKITARFTDELVPLAATQGTIRGRIVNFPAFASLRAKQTLTYTISVQGGRPGDSRNKITLTCEELKTPVEQEESTTVY